MAELFSWVKLGIENWKVLLGILTFIASLFGNGVLAFSNVEKDEQISATQKQVAAVAQAYYPMVKEKPAKPVVQCFDCSLLMDKHIKELH